MGLGKTSTLVGGTSTVLSVSSTVTDGNLEGAMDATTLLGVGGTLTTMALTLDDSENKEKVIRKTANVVDYLETYNVSQKNDLIDQIDDILEEKENSLKLTKKF